LSAWAVGLGVGLDLLAVSGGRVVLRPDGSPIIEVKSPIRKMTVCPRSCSWRILLSTTVWPMWMSGAVGSRPSLMRRGVPVASERTSFAALNDTGPCSTDLQNLSWNSKILINGILAAEELSLLPAWLIHSGRIPSRSRRSSPRPC
jgi:hypothetical protein